MQSHPRGHILVWTRDLALAGLFRQQLESFGFRTSWAAALHEAIAAVWPHFPLAIVGTLDGEIPSLMDLETLLTYLSMGNRTLSLPPIPIWALSTEPERFREEIARLGLPIHLFPAATGVAALTGEVARCLCRRGGARGPTPAAAALDVLLVEPDDSEAGCFAGYLQSRGLRARSIGDPGQALALLAEQPVRAVATELFATHHGVLPFLEQLARQVPAVPVIVITGDRRWLNARPGSCQPANVACTLAKPVKVTALEACLRRLLRIPAPDARALSPASR